MAFCFQDNFVFIINELKRRVTRPKSNCGLCSATNYYRQSRNTSPEPGTEAGLGTGTILQMTRAQFTTLQQTRTRTEERPTNPTLGSIFAAPRPETGATDILPSEYEAGPGLPWPQTDRNNFCPRSRVRSRGRISFRIIIRSMLWLSGCVPPALHRAGRTR